LPETNALVYFVLAPMKIENVVTGDFIIIFLSAVDAKTK
jgi:hypothetical protein